jgi:glycosyltransferase involved in cell wall biosynthesis
MKVSVIVPVCNTGRYLRKCLQSLKEQSLHDIEIICVNDGSIDNSREIIEQFVKEDCRFRAIHKQNTGYGHSVNMGIKAAQSPYIGIVESDDFVELDMFQRLYDVAEENKAELVKSNYNSYKENPSTSVVFEEMLSAFPYEQIFSIKDHHKFFGIPHPSVWSALYRKSFLEDNDIWFLETPGASYQDISFTFKVCVNAERVYFIRDAFLNYRVDNIDSSVHNPLKIFCVCDELHEIERYIRKRAEVGAIKKEWLEELYSIVGWIKYRKYIWNYTRLSIAYQYAFLMKVIDELKDIRQLGYKSEAWENGEKEMLDRVIVDPNEFFRTTGKVYEDPRMSLIPVLNHSFSIRYFQELVTEFQKIYIYGAGLIGKQSWNCLKNMNAGNKVQGFIVSEREDNPRQIEDKGVFALSEIQGQNNKQALVIVAMHMRYQYEVALKLQKGGYLNILLIDDKIKLWLYENMNR